MSLDETYTTALRRIREEDFRYALKILQWLSCTKRPLEFRELAEVVAIDVKHGLRLKPETRLKEPQDLLGICSSLVSLSESEKMSASAQENGDSMIVQLAPDVKEYLVSERILHGHAQLYGFLEVEANTTIYEDCLTYLLELCETSPLVSVSNTLDEFPLAEYAARYWAQHAQLVERGTSLEPILTKQFLMKGNRLLNWIRLYNPDNPWEGPNLERDLNSICPPLYYASTAGLARSARLLLNKGVDVNAQGGKYGNALQAASRGGYYELVQLLLNKGADVNAQGGFYENALQTAAYYNHYEILRLLIERGAEVNVQGGFYGNALQAASQAGHYRVVQLLLDQGADVNAQGGYYGNALRAAASGDHLQTVQLLLDLGANVNAQGGAFGTALQTAAGGGHHQIVQLLLDGGAHY
ncbi:MAG: hypothetical protein LQ351_008152 [Letrouitia transgressa]|nr:MAG: hypothetical protein LQ351_008152 [Letrouitia transgressa]